MVENTVVTSDNGYIKMNASFNGIYIDYTLIFRGSCLESKISVM